jgi:hypothetical protein
MSTTQSTVVPASVLEASLAYTDAQLARARDEIRWLRSQLELYRLARG